MPGLTQAFIDDSLQKFASLAPDAKPAWGVMTPPQLFGHLTIAVRYSLGKEDTVPDEGGWFGHTIVAPLILNGYLKFPKNVGPLPKMYERQDAGGTADALRAEIFEFWERLQAGGGALPPHPYFGDVGPLGWSKIHHVHFQHHMRQFRLA